MRKTYTNYRSRKEKIELKGEPKVDAEMVITNAISN